ncbi:MAG: hypothetical protein IJQ67_07290 [Bacilli bacterium]|nr:hypothetical protein [Bacilli bacterium]
MKVNFVRKPTPSELYPQDEFIIEKVVKLSKEEFEDLLKNPLNDRSYVRDNKSLMFEDKDGYWHCIYVVAEDYDYGILIESEGSDYPRYTADLPKALFDLK